MEKSTITRYQLVRAFILVVTIALMVYWWSSAISLLLSQKWGVTLLFFPRTMDGELGVTRARITGFLSPISLLICWPLLPVLIRAMLRTQGNETVTSARDLRFLLLPCIGAILLLCALITAGYSSLYLIRRLTYMILFSTGYGLPTNEEMDALDYAIGVSCGFFQNAIVLFVGIQIIRERYLKSRESVLLNPAPVAQQISLTRFEIVRAYVGIVLLAALVQWLYFLPFEVGIYFRADRAMTTNPNAQYTSLLYDSFAAYMAFDTAAQLYMFAPLALILFLPFTSPIAHLMTGGADRELVESRQQLRSLAVPCVGLFVFIWLFRSAPFEVWQSYSNLRVSMVSSGFWEFCWQILFWPTLKCSLALAFMVYPSICDMVSRVKGRA